MCYISHIVIFIRLYLFCIQIVFISLCLEHTRSYLVGIVGTDSYFFHCRHVETMFGTYYLVGFVGSKCFG